jgi:DNA-binding protein HU-beta
LYENVGFFLIAGGIKTLTANNARGKIYVKEENSVNKTELVTSVAEKSGMTKKDAEKALNAVFESIEDALKGEDKVQIIGFGTFEVKAREERKGRNPQTGAEITIPASKTPVFKAGKGLKDLVNQ